MKDKKQIIFIIIVIVVAVVFWNSYKNGGVTTEKNTEESITKEEVLEREEQVQKGEEVEDLSKSEEDKSDEEVNDEEKAVRETVTSFESVYKSKDKNKMFNYFTDPVSQTDIDTKERLLNGKDMDGNIGGPTLFVTNLASEIPDEFVFSKVIKEGDVYNIVVTENRKSISGNISQKKRILKLNMVEGNWLIDSYESEDYSGKYTGFLSN